MSDLQVLSNVPVNVTIGGKSFKVSSPTFQDLAESEVYGKQLKQEKRKEYIKQYTELFSSLPKEMGTEEKKEVLKSILPAELTPKDKLELFASMPESWDEDKKNKHMLRLIMERDGIEWNETLYLLWICIKKHQTEVKFDDIKSIATTEDLDVIMKVISPKKVGDKEKNV